MSKNDSFERQLVFAIRRLGSPILVVLETLDGLSRILAVVCYLLISERLISLGNRRLKH